MEEETFRTLKEVVAAIQSSGGSLETVVADIIEKHNNDLTSDQKLQLAARILSSHGHEAVHKKTIWENDYF